MRVRVLLFIGFGLFCCAAIRSGQRLVTSFAGGISRFTTHNDQTLIISDYISDTLLNAHQDNQAAFSLAFQKGIPIDQKHINKILLGPAVYYQQARFYGDVYELNDPTFYNYTYKESANLFQILMQGDVYLNTPSQRILPFISLAAGINITQLSYQERALPGIDSDSSLMLPAKTNGLFAGAVGIGLSSEINQHWDVFARYLYSMSQSAHSSLSKTVNLQTPIKLALNNQAIYMGVSFHA